MATNKWLTALAKLKDVTNTLRQNLRSGEIACSDDELLEELVAKVPSLSPKTYDATDDGYHWQPDPLWTFPDPNGSSQRKTIRQIYDEDTLKNDFTYSGIYLIYGNVNTMDLKAVFNKAAASYTFITSDGARYNDNTDTSLMHMWDETKDVIDSTGRHVRYVRVYTSTNTMYVPGFYRQLIWAIHNLGNQINSSVYTGKEMTLDFHEYERLELESNFGKSGYIYMMYNTGLPKTLLCNFACNNSNYTLNNLISSSSSSGVDMFRAGTHIVREMKLPQVVDGRSISLDSNRLYFPRIRKLSIPKGYTSVYIYPTYLRELHDLDMSEATSLTTLYIYDTGYYSSNNSSFTPTGHELYVNVPPSVTTFYGYGLCQSDISLPANLTSLTLGRSFINALTVPEKVTSLSLNYLPNLMTLAISEAWGKISSTQSTSFVGLYNLRNLILPQDFDRALNVSNSEFLEHDSIVDMLNNLKNNKGLSAKALVLGSVNLAKLTAEEKAIATNKNWTLS